MLISCPNILIHATHQYVLQLQWATFVAFISENSFPIKRWNFVIEKIVITICMMSFTNTTSYLTTNVKVAI